MSCNILEYISYIISCNIFEYDMIYHIVYHIISCNIFEYDIISYHVISLNMIRYIMSYIISYFISCNIFEYCKNEWGRDSSVGMVTTLGMAVWFDSLQKQDTYLFSKRPRPTLGPPQFNTQLARGGGSFPGIKCCAETSVTNYQPTPPNIPEERRPQRYRGKSLKFSNMTYNCVTSTVANLTLRLLISYIYGAPSKARNANVVYIWTYVWQRW